MTQKGGSRKERNIELLATGEVGTKDGQEEDRQTGSRLARGSLSWSAFEGLRGRGGKGVR